MKKIIFTILVFGFLIVSGCSQNDDTVEVESYNYGEEINLKYNETVYIKDSDTKITFSEVISDSRCPSDAECIWVGEASIVLLFESGDGGKIFPFEASFLGISQEMYFTVGDMSVELQELSPYPKTTTEISVEDYTLKMIVRESSYEPFKE